MPDERRDWLLPRALRVADPRLADAARAILFRAAPVRRSTRCSGCSGTAEPFVLDAGPWQLSGQRCARRSSNAAGPARAVPIATPAEVLASLTILSFRPGRPSTQETIDAALRDRGPGRARDRQRAPLPAAEAVRGHDAALAAAAHRSRTLPGSSSATPTSPPRASRSAATSTTSWSSPTAASQSLLGDVTGHGIEAAADMAMAKFVFRSLAREHPEPGDFLAVRERRRRRRDRAGQVHHDGLPRRSTRRPARSQSPGPAIRHRASSAQTEPSSRSTRRASCSASNAGRPTRRCAQRSRSATPSSSTPTASSRRAATASSTDLTVSTRALAERVDARRLRSSPQAVLDDCRAFAAGELADDCAVVVVRPRVIELRRPAGASPASATAAPRRSLPRTHCAAFELAVELGCDMIEFDVLVANGEVVRRARCAPCGCAGSRDARRGAPVLRRTAPRRRSPGRPEAPRDRSRRRRGIAPARRLRTLLGEHVRCRLRPHGSLSLEPDAAALLHAPA